LSVVVAGLWRSKEIGLETTFNDVDGLKTFRAPEQKPDAPESKQLMGKGDRPSVSP
jgi:hypothetical protein